LYILVRAVRDQNLYLFTHATTGLITMAMFKMNPMTATTKDRDAAKANGDRLAARLIAAEQAVVARRHEAEQLALDGAADAALDKAEAALRAALDRQSTIAAASTEAGKLLALLESKLAELADKQTRAATAVTVEAWATRLEEIGEEIGPLLSELADIAAKAFAAQIWDANGLATFSKACVSQIPDGCGLVARSVREYAVRVQTGLAGSTLLQAEAPRAAAVIAPSPVVRLFTLQNVSWTVDGRLMTMGKFTDCDLPVETAKRALACRACAPLDSDARRQWSNTRAITRPDPSECVSLDGAEIVKLDDTPVVDGQLTRIDRGKPYEATILRKA
jgi:hypothetical protein